MSIVATPSGKVMGRAEDGILAFKGIPYARPPLGERRFARPEPPAPWTGVREATAFGPHAWQVVYPFFDPDFDDDPSWDAAREFHRGAVDGPVVRDEDCLVLNVWTPATTGRRPVMVWLHGGGFAAGSGSWGWWSGQGLAYSQDVVVVSLNHRLNLFGYLFVPEAKIPPNLGMQDIVLALQWVRDAIAGFGGDPGNVTIFGQSGGGMKVSTLMAMPSARGLFHKAIVQSGPFLRAVPQARAIAAGRRALDTLGVGWDGLARVSPQEIVRAFAASGEGGPGVPRQFAPVADGDVLPRDPFHPDCPPGGVGIPLLIGATPEEVTSLIGFRDPSIFSIPDDALVDRVSAACSLPAAAARDTVDAYRTADPAASASRVFARIVSDRRFGHPSIVEAERHAAAGPTWAYRLTYEAPLLAERMGTPHNIDLPLLFCPDKAPGMFGTDTGHLPLARFMQDAWGRFARDGDPGWERFDTLSRATMRLDRTCRVENDPNRGERLAQEALGPLPP